MKIANLACAWPPYAGGIANAAYQIGTILAEQHSVENFTPAHLKPWLQYGHGACLPQLLWRLKDFDYIYLHYPFFGSAELVWLFKIFSPKRPKLIIHYHMDVEHRGWGEKILSWPGRLTRTGLLRRADKIISASLDYVKAGQLKKYYFEHPEKFQEIPFGLDLEKFQPKVIDRPTENKIIARAQEIIHYVNDKFIKRERLNFLFVGGLDKAHYFKGLPILLEALAGLNADRWRLEIIGTGQQKNDYEKMSAELGLGGRVKFAGHKKEEDLIRAYQNADLLILPSTNSNEAFGLVLIEALACATPLIASDLPGVRRVFDNYQEGLLVEPGSVSDLRKKLEFILNNEKLRKEMSIAARRRAEKKYDLKIMRQSLLALFENQD